MSTQPFRVNSSINIEAFEIMLDFGVNDNSHWSVQGIFSGTLEEIRQFSGKKISLKVEQPKYLADIERSGEITNIQSRRLGDEISGKYKYDVMVTCNEGDIYHQVRHCALFVSSSGKPENTSTLLKSLLDQYEITGGEMLNMPVFTLAQFDETDSDFLQRIAAWHGLVIASNINGKLKIIDLAKVKNSFPVESDWIEEEDVEFNASSLINTAVVPQWNIPRAIEDKAVTVKRDVDVKLQWSDPGVKSGVMNTVLPGQHYNNTAKSVALGQLAQSQSDSVVWRVWLRLPESAAGILNADHIDVPGIGVLAIWKRKVDTLHHRDRWRVYIEARDPASLPQISTTVYPRDIPGQISSLKDPENLGRIKVNLPGIKKGTWCIFNGGGGVNESGQVHGTWVPPQPLDWVWVNIDPNATTEPRIIDLITHRGCNAQALKTKNEGPWVLFQEGDLRLQADIQKKEWLLSAGKNQMTLSAEQEKGTLVNSSSIKIQSENETIMKTKKLNINGDSISISGKVQIDGKLQVK